MRSPGRATAGSPVAARKTGPALEAAYQFILWLSPTIGSFSRRCKFTLGDRMETTALDELERLIEATYARQRRKLLTQANLGVQKLRILCRIARERHYQHPRKYERVMRVIDDTGSLIGG